jgi:hypothetical protein
MDRGHAALAVGPEKPAKAMLPLRIPAVKEGVVLEAQLTVALYTAADVKPAAVDNRTVRIFAADPFADRGQWLKGLAITLFDPEKKTADLFDKAHIPYKYTRNTSMLDELDGGLLVIGEGTAWKDYASLGQSVVKAASRGVPVLCLAPGEGSLALPGADGADSPAPAAVTLRRENVIGELDKRLDRFAWPPDGQIAVSRLEIKGDRDQAVLEFGRGDRGWPWLDVRYPAPRGRLWVCGFGIVRYWEAGPACGGGKCHRGTGGRERDSLAATRSRRENAHSRRRQEGIHRERLPQTAPGVRHSHLSRCLSEGGQEEPRMGRRGPGSLGRRCPAGRLSRPSTRLGV